MGILKRIGEAWLKLERDVTPLEGTRISLYNNQIPAFWQENNLGQWDGAWMPGGAALAERVWAASRCTQLNSQQIGSMPLVFHGTGEPAWVSSPDPDLFPNGIGDAIAAIVSQVYNWGYSLQFITDRYADGFPRTWTVIPSAACEPTFDKQGRRQYKLGDTPLNPRDIIQIDRNPTTAAHGTSALRAFAQNAWGMLAAGNQSMTVNQGGIPKVYFRPQKSMTKEQAETLQAQWMQRTSERNGAPPIVPKDLDVNELSFNPSDLSLLDTQEFNAKTIATAYGVPAYLLNLSLDGGMTYQNPAMLGEMWWRFELRPTATRIANAFTAQALPRGSWVSFDAADTFAVIDEMSDDDDEQGSQVAKATPNGPQRPPLSAIEGGGG